MIIEFHCEYCGQPHRQKASQYKRKKHHFCSQKCYNMYRTDILPPEEQNAWQGGISAAESNRRWRERNRKKVAIINRNRRQREYNAPGKHTQKEWEHIRDVTYAGRCAQEDETCKGPITKDHKVPLEMGGSNNPDNLEPLCRSHNARKGIKVRLGVYDAHANELVLKDTKGA